MCGHANVQENVMRWSLGIVKQKQYLVNIIVCDLGILVSQKMTGN
jgi:hypothetical protein